MPNPPTYRSSVLIDRIEDTAVELESEVLTLEQLDALFSSMNKLMQYGYRQMRRIAEDWVGLTNGDGDAV